MDRSTSRAPTWPHTRPSETELAARRDCLDALRVRGSSGMAAYLTRSASLYDEAVVTDLLHRAGRPDFGDMKMLGRILTVEMALRTADASLDRN